MPTYEFLCEQCGDKTEYMFRITKAPRHVQCSKCSNDKAIRLIGKSGGIALGLGVRDGAGTPIWCPDGGYYDRALQRPFRNAKEKREYMKQKNVVMDGSETPSKNFKKHDGSGDFKEKAARQQAQMED